MFPTGPEIGVAVFSCYSGSRIVPAFSSKSRLTLIRLQSSCIVWDVMVDEPSWFHLHLSHLKVGSILSGGSLGFSQFSSATERT